MRIRLSRKIIDLLKEAQAAYGFSYSQIAGKAIRKYNRVKPDLTPIDTDSTYGGETYRLTIISALPHSEIRAILCWYLDLNLPAQKREPFIPDQIAGLHYTLAPA